MAKLGHHYIAELWGCPYDTLNDPVRLEMLMRQAAEVARVTVLNSTFNQFNPHGVTGLLLLSESHLSIHTWPEHGYGALDLFTCGDRVAAREAVLEFASRMGASRLELQILGRGYRRTPPSLEGERRVFYPPFQWTLGPDRSVVSEERPSLFRPHDCAK